MRPIHYLVIDAGSPYLMRGTNQQTQTGLLYTTPTLSGLATVTTGAAGTVARGQEGLTLGGWSLHNRSGGSMATGLGVRLGNGHWLAGSWTDAAATPFVDATSAAQNVTAADFALETLTANDGYVLASDVPFNAVSINVATASAGGSPVRALRYTNAAGSGWTTFGTNTYAFSGSSGVLSQGEAILVFNTPADWGAITGSGLSGIPPGYYAINVRATTAPSTTAAVATAIEVIRLYFVTASVANNGTYEPQAGAQGFYMPAGNALVAFFGTADIGNRASALVMPGKW